MRLIPDRGKILLQYCLPQHFLSHITGMLANCKWRWFKNWAIKRLIRKYDVNLDEAASSNIADYPTFNSFFTRQLKPGCRPVVPEKNAAASPADGTIYQAGKISEGTLFQAKDFYFSVESLLGGSNARARPFLQGSYATIYLAPRDYHRVHMPLDGTLREMIYIPGQLFSVNPLTSHSVPALFARNERLVCLFETDTGPMAVILVGAMLVGKMKTVWSSEPCKNPLTVQRYSEKESALIFLRKGHEIGHFEMGSTVITLLGQADLTWKSSVIAGEAIKMGQRIFQYLSVP